MLPGLTPATHARTHPAEEYPRHQGHARRERQGAARTLLNISSPTTLPPLTSSRARLHCLYDECCMLDGTVNQVLVSPGPCSLSPTNTCGCCALAYAGSADGSGPCARIRGGTSCSRSGDAVGEVVVCVGMDSTWTTPPDWRRARPTVRHQTIRLTAATLRLVDVVQGRGLRS